MESGASSTAMKASSFGFVPGNGEPSVSESRVPRGDQSADINGSLNPKKEALFIGGMACSTDLSELQKHLRSLAGLSSGLFVSMVNRIKRKSFSGYGIIKNVEPKVAEKLLQIKNFKFQGCWYGIKPFLKKKSQISKIRNERAEKKVYMNGIVEKLVENDLEVYFSKYGQVLHVQISKHPGTNTYKGFGFVEFDTVESAQLVLSLHHHEIKGNTLVCQLTNFAKKFKEPEKPSTSSSQGQADPQAFSSKFVSRNNLTATNTNREDGSSSLLPDLIRMCPNIAKNHTLANVAFRVRFQS